MKRAVAMGCLAAAWVSPALAQTILTPRNGTTVVPARPLTPATPLTPAPAPAPGRNSTPAAPIAGAAPTTPVAAAARESTERVICRGGPSFSIKPAPPGPPIANANPGGELFYAYFGLAIDGSGHKPAAGENARGLKPGTCAFEQRAWDAEPPGIYFQTLPGDPAQVRADPPGSYPPASVRADGWSIPTHLSSSSNYWRFDVRDSKRGYLLALDHGIWRPGVTASTELTAAGTATPELALGRAMNVQVAPLAGGVQIDFDGPPRCGNANGDCTISGSNAFYVELKTVRVTNRTVSTLTAEPQPDGRWRATTRSQKHGHLELLHNEDYEYVLKHQVIEGRTDKDRSSRITSRLRGTFRTLASNVTVRVDTIDLHAFRPSLGDDLEVRLELNPQEPGKGGWREVRGMIPSRRTFQIGEEIPVTGIRRVRLLVTVITSRRNPREACYEVRRPAEPGKPYFETIAGYVDGCVEIGLAKLEYNLGTREFSGLRVQKEFSVNGGNAGPDDIKFAVHGRVIVTRPR